MPALLSSLTCAGENRALSRAPWADSSSGVGMLLCVCLVTGRLSRIDRGRVHHSPGDRKAGGSPWAAGFLACGVSDTTPGERPRSESRTRCCKTLQWARSVASRPLTWRAHDPVPRAELQRSGRPELERGRRAQPQRGMAGDRGDDSAAPRHPAGQRRRRASPATGPAGGRLRRRQAGRRQRGLDSQGDHRRHQGRDLGGVARLHRCHDRVGQPGALADAPVRGEPPSGHQGHARGVDPRAVRQPDQADRRLDPEAEAMTMPNSYWSDPRRELEGTIRCSFVDGDDRQCVYGWSPPATAEIRRGDVDVPVHSHRFETPNGGTDWVAVPADKASPVDKVSPADKASPVDKVSPAEAMTQGLEYFATANPFAKSFKATASTE